MTVQPTSGAHPTTEGSRQARKVGYLVATVVNCVLSYVVNVRPGWREPSFLSEDFAGILWLINLSMITNAAGNMIYLCYDPAGFKSVCQIGVSAIGLAAAVRTLQVFPFDFSAYSVNWAAVANLLLALDVFGSFVAIVTELARLASGGISAADQRHFPHKP